VNKRTKRAPATKRDTPRRALAAIMSEAHRIALSKMASE
jgi:hypothetical protein